MKRTEINVLGDVINKFKKESIGLLYFDRIKTGFPKFDNMLGGGLAPGLTILGAVSNLGKSTFVLQLAENVAQSGVPVLFFSMEMTATRIAAKSISREMFLKNGTYKDGSSIPSDKLLSKFYMDNLSVEKWAAIEKTVEKAGKKNSNLHIIEGGPSMKTATDIAEYVREFIEKEWHEGRKAKPLVIIDYLQILDSDASGGPRAEIDDNIRIIKQLAGERMCDEAAASGESTGLPVLVVSSIGRQYYRTSMCLEAFKESGNIEYSSDVVLGLQFTKVDKDDFDADVEKSKFMRRVSVVALKQRYGMCGVSTDFAYCAKYDCFLDTTSVPNEVLPEVDTIVKSHIPAKKRSRKKL